MGTDRRQLLAGVGAVLTAGGCASGVGQAAHAAPKAANFDAAWSFQAESGGDAMVVMRNGRIVYERYGEGRDPAQLNSIASATKSFWGPVGAALIGDGLIGSWDEPAAETLTEWRGEARKSKITLRHLLSLTSGLEGDSEGLQGAGPAEDKYGLAIQAAAAQEPGATFTYGPVNYYVFGEIVRRKLAGRYKDPLEFLDSRFLKPLGITRYEWLRDGKGNPNIPNGCSISARDWARFGDMVLNRGVGGGRRLAPEAALRECFRPAPANPGYGLTYWLNTPGGSLLGERAPAGSPGGGLFPGGEPDMFAAIGAGRNGLYMIPSHKMVVVRQRPYQERRPDMTMRQHLARSRAWQGNFNDGRFIQLVLAGAGGRG